MDGTRCMTVRVDGDLVRVQIEGDQHPSVWMTKWEALTLARAILDEVKP